MSLLQVPCNVVFPYEVGQVTVGFLAFQAALLLIRKQCDLLDFESLSHELSDLGFKLDIVLIGSEYKELARRVCETVLEKTLGASLLGRDFNCLDFGRIRKADDICFEKDNLGWGKAEVLCEDV